MTGDDAADRLQLRMQRIRRRLDTDVDGILQDAQQLLDWRYYVQRQPLGSLIAMSLLGYLLVPSRREAPVQKVYLDPEVSREYVAQKPPVSEARQEAAPVGQGIFLSLATLALNTAVRSGITYATSVIQDVLQREFQMSGPRQERADDPYKKWSSNPSDRQSSTR